jgi:hypothetical protein
MTDLPTLGLPARTMLWTLWFSSALLLPWFLEVFAVVNFVGEDIVMTVVDGI